MLRPLSNSSIQETNPLKVCIRTTQHLLPGVEKRRDGCTIPWQLEGICSQFDTWSQNLELQLNGSQRNYQNLQGLAREEAFISMNGRTLKILTMYTQTIEASVQRVPMVG
jgi:hypothetical protein